MSAYSRPVLLLLCGLLLFTISIAVLNTLVPLWLSSTVADLASGMVSSSYFTGNLVGTLIAGRFIQQLGFNRSYHCSCILFALATCGLMLTVDFGAGWVGAFGGHCLRADLGHCRKCFITQWYLNQPRTTTGGLHDGLLFRDRHRAIIIGYSLHTTAQCYSLGGALVITAMLPLLFAQFSHQSRHESPPIAVWPMLKRRSARLGINGCIISGVLLGSLYGLLPLYLSHKGMSDASVGVDGVAGQFRDYWAMAYGKNG